MFKGFGKTQKTSEKFYFYYLPCLNPYIDTVGGVISSDKPFEIGETIEMWDWAVIVAEVPSCKKRAKPDLHKLPVLKVINPGRK